MYNEFKIISRCLELTNTPRLYFIGLDICQDDVNQAKIRFRKQNSLNELHIEVIVKLFFHTFFFRKV